MAATRRESLRRSIIDPTLMERRESIRRSARDPMHAVSDGMMLTHHLQPRRSIVPGLKPTDNEKVIVEIIATISGSLTKVSQGIQAAWPSPSLPKLTEISSEEGAWIASALSIGDFASVFLVLITVDVIGRKTGIVLSCIPVIVSWIGIAWGDSFQMLLISRIIGGIGCGYGKIVIGTYIAEIAQADVRGALGTVMSITYILGVLFLYSVAPYLSVPLFAYISCAIPVVCMLTFIWMPETPYFYLLQNREDKAEKVLRYIRGTRHITNELDKMVVSVEARVKLKVAFVRLFSQRKNRRPLFVIGMLYTSIQFTGKLPLLAYNETIFRISNSSITPYWGTIITTLFQLVSLIICIFIIDRSGRRLLLVLSCLGCSATLAVLGAYFFFLEHMKYDLSDYGWVPVTMLSTYNFVFSLGLGNVPFIMVGELFSSDVKALAVCICSLILPLGSVLNLIIFELVTRKIGVYLIFTVFACISALSALFSYIFVPETKGKTLAEIQQFFK